MFIASTSTRPSRRPETSRDVPCVFKCPYPGPNFYVRWPDCSSLNCRIVTFQLQLKLISSAIQARVAFQTQVPPTRRQGVHSTSAG